jgi:hypothetical protein
VVHRKKSSFVGPIILIFLSSSGCMIFNPDRQYSIHGAGSNASVILVFDSPVVRKLVSDENVREEGVNRSWQGTHTNEERIKRVQDMGRHPEKYPPGRSEFLGAMANMPGIYVPSKSYCRVLERSESKCGPTPIHTSVYVLVRGTTGRSRGTTGWVCDGNVQK